MDGHVFTRSPDQAQIDRRLKLAIADLEHVVDRVFADLEFETGGAIDLAIQLKVLANGEPSSHDVFLVKELIKRAFREPKWTVRRAFKALREAH